ncbi:MAG: IS4 family transposase, partial [Nitrospinota bacterium]
KYALTLEEYNSLPHRIWVREIEVSIEIRGFRTKHVILATTLTDSLIYTRHALAELYLRRWEAEINLRYLKTILKMEMLKSKTPAMDNNKISLSFI